METLLYRRRVHSFARSFIDRSVNHRALVGQSFVSSVGHSYVRLAGGSIGCMFGRSFVCSVPNLYVRSLVLLFSPSFVCSVPRSFVRFLVRLFGPSFVCSIPRSFSLLLPRFLAPPDRAMEDTSAVSLRRFPSKPPDHSS